MNHVRSLACVFGIVGVAWAGFAAVPGSGSQVPDAPAQALAAYAAAQLPAPVLLWDHAAPNAKGDSDEDKPAIYAFLPAKEKATGCGNFSPFIKQNQRTPRLNLV